MVQRTTIVLPEDLLDRLRRIAAERGVSLATVMREAAEEKVSGHRPKAKSFGLGASGKNDTGRKGSDLYQPDTWR
ncbi:MAG: ribbon-helix-helix protein, CopG family [Chloroflexi bacterium]|nr:MAG: ribbon-helix-helix protein, CopG family [Chloroflexota bacterium]